jgi:hypothetical protein
MSKTRKRKRAASRLAPENVEVLENAAGEIQNTRAVRKRALSVGGPSQQNLAFSLMVALGFWGLAVFCVFFFAADPNHYLYGGIMALTAVGWSFLVARKWSAYRQGVRA